MRSFLLATCLCAFVFSVHAQLERDSVHVLIDHSEIIYVKVVDLDGDNDLDILGSNNGYNGQFLWFENTDGMGNFSPATSFGDTIWEDFYIYNPYYSLADMDNDGDIDIVTNETAKLNKPFWENLGDIQFQKPEAAPSLVPSSYTLVEDLNADGWADVLYLGSNFNIWINWNQGEGQNFILEQVSGLSYLDNILKRNAVLFDYNQDGDLDFVIPSLKPNPLNGYDDLYIDVYERTCPACFQLIESAYLCTAADINVTPRINIVCADYDQDGWIDFSVSFDCDNSSADFLTGLQFWKNITGSGNFEKVHEISDLENHIAFDFNYDGLPDVMAVDHNGIIDSMFMLQNMGSFDFDISFHEVAIKLGSEYIPADINSDGKLDILGSHNFAGNDFLGIHYAIDSLGNFELQTTVNNHWITEVTNHLQYDWDGDGDLDLLVLGTGGILSVNGGLYWFEYVDAEDRYEKVQLISRLTDNMERGDLRFPNIQFCNLNNDDTPDVVGVGRYDNKVRLFHTIITSNENEQETIIHSDLHPLNDNAGINCVDLDNDGDKDIVTLTYNDKIAVYWNEIQEGNGLVYEYDYFEKPIPGNQFHVYIHASDVDQDQNIDFIYFTPDSIYFAKNLDGSGIFSEWQSIVGCNYSGYNLLFEDWDGDGDTDIKYPYKGADGIYSWLLSLYNSELHRYDSPFMVEWNFTASPGPTRSVSLKGDGTPDMISTLGYNFTFPGLGFHSIPYLPTPFEDEMLRDLAYNPGLLDMNMDQKEDLITGTTALIWTEIDFAPWKSIKGSLQLDPLADCIYNTENSSLKDWNVSIKSDEVLQLGKSNQLGFFGALMPEADQHHISVEPISAYWDVCPDNYVISSEDINDGQVLEFTGNALTECALLEVEMAATPVRQCFASTVSLKYKNKGTISIEDATITLYHDERFTPVSSTFPWSESSDTSLIFELPEIGLSEEGQFSIELEPDCSGFELGEWTCFTAEVKPDSLCNHPAFEWRGASLEASSFCLGDSLTFTITNIGNGSMPTPQPYFIVVLIGDSEIDFIDLGLFQLQAGETDSITIYAPDQIALLTVEQPWGHPVAEDIQLLVQSCPTPNWDAWDNVCLTIPRQEGNPFTVDHCNFIIGPYDPNIKVAIPEGRGPQHFIESDLELNYTIHFQNTGSDIARTVVLRDTLPPHLDISTFEPGASSHHSEWSILPTGELVVVFPEINLPDSTANEPGSHGFFSYFIQPFEATPPLTLIENRAGIFFDFNPPIITNTVFHTIVKPQKDTIIATSICQGDVYQDITIHQDTVIKFTFEMSTLDSIVWHWVSVVETDTVEQFIQLEEAGEWNGIWIESDTSITTFFTNTLGCDSLVITHLNVITNLLEPSWSELVTISPNPTHDNLNVGWEKLQKGPSHLTIHSSVGELILSKSLSSSINNINLNLKKIPSGIYILELWRGTSCYRRKINIL